MEISANLLAIALVMFGGAFLAKAYLKKAEYLKRNKLKLSKSFCLNAKPVDTVSFWHPKRRHIGSGSIAFEDSEGTCVLKAQSNDVSNFVCRNFGEFSVATYDVTLQSSKGPLFSNGTLQVTRIFKGSELIHEHASYV